MTSLRDPRPLSEMPGLGAQIVKIEAIGDDGFVEVRDRAGTSRRLKYNLQRSSGPRPRVGEFWLIDRHFGVWGFAAILQANPRGVIGNLEDGSLLESMFEALRDDGLISGEITTVERIVDTFAYRTASAGTLLVVGTPTTIAFGTEVMDPQNRSGSTTIWTVGPAGGVFQVSARVGVPSVAGERFIISIAVDGSEVRRGTDMVVPTSGTVAGLWVDASFPLAPDAVVEIKVQQVNGTPRTTESSGVLSYCHVRRTS